MNDNWHVFKFQLNLWQNINEERFKVEYLIKLSQYFRNLAEAVMRLYSKTFFSQAFKVLADFNELFNFKKFLIYVFAKNLRRLRNELLNPKFGSPKSAFL